MYFGICRVLADRVMNRNVSSVKTIVDGAKDHPDVMTSLFRATYRKCGILKWTEVLEFEFSVFNATFRNISAISWTPVLVVEEAGVPGENHRPWASNW